MPRVSRLTFFSDERPPAVVVSNLRRAYGDRIIIRNLNLRIERGEFVALLGESGCGKTTLLRALAGLDPIEGGRIVAPRRPAWCFRAYLACFHGIALAQCLAGARRSRRVRAAASRLP